MSLTKVTERIMLLIAFQTFTLIIAGLMVGNELAVGAFIHPQLYRLDDKIHVASAQAFARVYGFVMPGWYALTLLLTTAFAFLLRQTETPFILATASAVFWLISILLTVIGLVPINNRVSCWDLENLPNDWKRQRSQWDRFHIIRVVILTIALICLITACLTATVG